MRKKHNPAAIAGWCIILAFCLIAIFADFIAPYDPSELGTAYLKPSAEHLLGTNDLGQDIFSEMVYGTRVSLLLGVFSALLVSLIGTALALIAGYFGGTADKTICAVIDVAMAVPSLPLTMLLIAYLKIEKAMGVSAPVIMVRHILPNLKDILLTRMALSVSGAMTTESGLSFLGLGTYGQKSWGNILHFAFFRNSILRKQIWWYLPPIICISVAVMGFMLVGYYGRQRRE